MNESPRGHRPVVYHHLKGWAWAPAVGTGLERVIHHRPVRRDGAVPLADDKGRATPRPSPLQRCAAHGAGLGFLTPRARRRPAGTAARSDRVAAAAGLRPAGGGLC